MTTPFRRHGILAVTGGIFAVTLLSAVFLAPPAGADTLFNVDRVAVYDANGRVIGSPLAPPAGLHVEFRLGSTPVILRVLLTGFESDLVRFANPGCTGQMRVDALWGELYRYSAIFGPRHTVWIQSGPVTLRTSRSTMTANGVCFDHDEPIRDFSAPVQPTDVHLADHFTPPFRIRSRAGAAVPAITP